MKIPYVNITTYGWVVRTPTRTSEHDKDSGGSRYTHDMSPSHYIFINFTRLSTKKLNKRECIPVGCVSSAPVAVYLRAVPGVRVAARGHLPQGAACPRGVVRQTHPPPVNRMTDSCENINLPQLHCGR